MNDSFETVVRYITHKVTQQTSFSPEFWEKLLLFCFLPMLLPLFIYDQYKIRGQMAAMKPKRPDGRKLLGLDCPLNEITTSWGGYYGNRDRCPNAIQDWSGTPRALRERAMISFMNQITDKPDWPRKIEDANIISKWKDEAAEQAKKTRPEETLTEKMIAYCIAELQDYAKEFAKHDFLPAIKASATVFKSDTIVPEAMRLALRDAAKPLENISEKHKDWHPGSGEKVLDLVHPSLFPLLYGRSRILHDGLVSLENCAENTGKGEIMPIPEEKHLQVSNFPGLHHHHGMDQHYYSRRFQWLPCEVAFHGEDRVKITSYINNLRPDGNEKLYSAIEDIIARAIPMWDATLASVETHHDLVRLELPRPHYIEPEGERPRLENEDELDEDDVYEADENWLRDNRIMVMPEAGLYRADEVAKEYTFPTLCSGQENSTKDPLKRGLREIFAGKGLQIIVKLANIHLTPTKPTYEGGSWHIEGQLNEHICASALYYYSSSNITPSHLSFRESMSADSFEWNDYEQDDYAHLETLYGIKNQEATIQELGSVLTPQSRLLTFPNVLQHRVSPFTLIDPTQSGHRKILALFLVDPYLRIPSTANVPPQQKDWWRESMQQADRVGDLPVELVDRIVDSVEDFPISLQEAKEIRLELMEERKIFVGEVEEQFQRETFSFCEH